MPDTVVVGCGYVGRRVAMRERAHGHRVVGLVRTGASAKELAAAGVEPWLADLDRAGPQPGPRLAGARVYWFAPPPSTGDRDPRLRQFLDALPETHLPRRVVLISTTGVYGDCAGAWVTEDRPPRPRAPRARRRLDAENALRAWSARTGIPAVILRVPGIYGPGKLPAERLQKGLPVLAESEAPWSNRVYVDDLVSACVAAMERGRPGGVYNVSDGHPSTMTDYFNRVADALGLPRPPVIHLDEMDGRMSAGMRSYLAESRRIDNRLMREELAVRLMCPDLATGLAACLGGCSARA